MAESRILQHLKEKDLIKRYHTAIDSLKALGIDLVLLENSVGIRANPQDEQGVQMAVAAHYETIGYKRCLNDLFSVLETEEKEEYIPKPDFGASDRMVESGELTKEEAESFMETK